MTGILPLLMQSKPTESYMVKLWGPFIFFLPLARSHSRAVSNRAFDTFRSSMHS